jgi:DNA (cytosine-5)-methyltransferase 1
MTASRSRARSTGGSLTSFEICAGAGGQALGLEQAGFSHAALVELDATACQTLRQNRPTWEVIEGDVHDVDGTKYRGVDLFSGGVPCPPFSVAGKQLGPDDDRDLFPVALRLIEECKPLAVMLENVPGLATGRFANYRKKLAAKLSKLGYVSDWQVLNACNYGVPQLRPRFVLVAFKTKKAARRFIWPAAVGTPPTVGERLVDLMSSRGWRGATRWTERAKGVGPTLVGGSKLHGGPDVGPTRARAAWLALGVDGRTIAEEPPPADFPVLAPPRLTVRMGARIQGFPDSWQITGRKTAAWRQVGNAFPPPVAEAVGNAVRRALLGEAVAVEPEQIALPFRIA